MKGLGILRLVIGSMMLLPRMYAYGAAESGVETRDVSEMGLTAALYLPESEGPHAAVITLGGSEGGGLVAKMEAAALAKSGYVALALQYFGAADLPATLENVSLEYFERALEYLESLSEVNAAQIAVMGMSRGGELAFMLGANFPQVKAVIAQVPSPIRWPAMTSSSFLLQNWAPAWSSYGRGLSFLTPVGWPRTVMLEDGRTAYETRKVFEDALSDQDIESAMIKIENTNGPIFMFGAEGDQVWPSCDFVHLAMERLKDRGHGFSDQGICYPGAGHAVALLPGYATPAAIEEDGYLLALGGTVEATASGQQDAWEKTIGFLRTILK